MNWSEKGSEGVANDTEAFKLKANTAAILVFNFPFHIFSDWQIGEWYQNVEEGKIKEKTNLQK